MNSIKGAMPGRPLSRRLLEISWLEALLPRL
jgi:hypothetical protein